MKMMQNDNRTAITYYRYSSHRQGEQSIEGQRAEAERWAKPTATPSSRSMQTAP